MIIVISYLLQWHAIFVALKQQEITLTKSAVVFSRALHRTVL